MKGYLIQLKCVGNWLVCLGMIGGKDELEEIQQLFVGPKMDVGERLKHRTSQQGQLLTSHLGND
jgi:hypothetical protein